MATIDLKALVGRLNEPCRRALEAAAGLTLSRTHYNVEIEHWLLKLADPADGDIAAILRHYEVDQARFIVDLNRALDRMKTGNARAPSLSPEIVELAKQAWLLCSVEHGVSRVRSGHLLWALLADETLARRARDASGQLLRIPADALKRDFAAVTAASSEASTTTPMPEGCADVPQWRGRASRIRRARAIHDRPDGDGAGREDRSDPRPRYRDSSGHRHPDAAAAKQPDPDRRGGSGKDRRRRGLRDAHRAGRRAAVAARRHRADARPRTVAGRRRGQRRVREPAQIGDRGGQGEPAPDHSVHRRGAHDDRRRRRGGTGRCRKPVEAGTGPRRAAHDRGDDLGRIQEVFRKGCRPDSPLPGGQGRGAGRGDGNRDGPRPRRDTRTTSRCAHPRRGGQRGGAAVRALHRRPAAS